MAAVSFASRLKDEQSLTIPKEAIDELGLHPGDEVQVIIRPLYEIVDQAYFNQSIDELLEQARQLKPEPGRSGSDPYAVALDEIIKDKYRKQGFDL